MKRLLALLLLITVLLTCACDISPDVPSGKCDTHVDSNDDGKCDNCYISVIVTVDFYAINDLHGKFADTDANEGVDEMTTYFKNAKKTDDHAIILSSGDMWQGGSESNLTEGRIVTDWMNEIGAVSMTLGNHEFDWGEASVQANSEIAKFPLLAINIYDKDTHERVEYCEASVVVECGGLQIGIIGAIGDCYSSISSDKTEEIYFKTGRELTELVKAESERLRRSGVDYIVYSLHDGGNRTSSPTISGNQLSSYYDIALSRDGYVDLVFEGHSHQSYVVEDTYGVYHLQGGGDNKGLSHVEIDLNSANFNSKVNEAEFVSASTYKYLEDDPIVSELLDKYEDIISVGSEVVGYNAYKRRSDFLRYLIAELYYKKGVEVWGDEYEISLGGGFISIRSPYELAAGEVTYGALQMLFPFDNQLVLCSIKGSDLKQRFLETDNSNYYCCVNTKLTAEIDNDKTYYVIVDSYSSPYAPNRLTEIDRFDPDVFARDLLADYIKAGGFEK